MDTWLKETNNKIEHIKQTWKTKLIVKEQEKKKTKINAEKENNSVKNKTIKTNSKAKTQLANW